jgi:ankyrin repeat protein
MKLHQFFLMLAFSLTLAGCNSLGRTAEQQKLKTFDHTGQPNVATQGQQQNRDFDKMMTAVSVGDKSAVASLLSKGVKAKASDVTGRTPLLLAAGNGYDEIVQLLINNGADVNAKTKNTLTPYGSLTPLFAAANYKGHAQTVRELLAAGADTEARDMHGETPLMAAARRGEVEIVKTLISAGANINALASQDNGTALMSAAAWGRAEVVRVLIQAGGQVNARTTSGYTTVMFAAEKGYTDIAKELIAAMADVTARTVNNDTALTLAERGNHKDTVKMLEPAGATR